MVLQSRARNLFSVWLHVKIKRGVWGETPLLSVEGLILCSLLELQVIIFLLSFSIERIVTCTWICPLTFNHIIYKCNNSFLVFVVTKIAVICLAICVPYRPLPNLHLWKWLTNICLCWDKCHLCSSQQSQNQWEIRQTIQMLLNSGGSWLPTGMAG